MCLYLEACFPGLAGTSYERTSCRDRRYNCIAWAGEDNTRPWWPVTDPKLAYWPGLIFDTSVAAFEQAFSTLGYSACGMDGSVEDSVQKVAIFAKDGQVTHMARQLFPQGDWTSKIGTRDIDIRHELSALEDSEYGQVVLILHRPLPAGGPP